MTIEAPTPITEAPSTRAPRKRQARKRKPTIRTPRTPENSFTASLRAQLAEKVAPCPHCGSPQGNKSAMTRDIGISIISLNKFLKGGRVSSDTVDAVYTYLNKS